MTRDISKAVVLITGGSSGIGYATARELSQRGATVFITSRSQESANVAAHVISEESGNYVEGLALDLSRMSSVRSFADAFSRRNKKLNILVNNAGMIAGKRIVTEDSLELTFAANFLGPFLLTQLLMPQLQATGDARILNVSSELYRNAKSGLDFSNLQLEKGFSSSLAYAQSKLAMMLFTLQLRERLNGSHVSSFAIHPGVIRTNFGSGPESSRSMKLMMKVLGPVLKSPEAGALTSIHLATAPLDSINHAWYWSEAKPGQPQAVALDKAAGRKLWEVSESLVSET